ncbi:tetratricopeptide repeat-containing response regulator [Pseudomonas sp. dw_358]|uniref:tetratricopeptide repeat-containing response regulator n=1 Tax=Pseudomonas sp. dw_358 TaxID=2720083 RepID=UPI002115FCCE|nr:tetratricopeptide repeat-containing response regulator [Pseudomonas sp. dw_358]
MAYTDKKFLIVDDFSDFRSSVRSMLRELGVKHIDMADTGEEALKICALRRYDFILHDFNLGDGKKNGQQVLEDLMSDKLMSHEAIFIMVTAENSQAMVMSALEWEPDAYLTKPFNRAGLAQRLDKLVQRKTLLKPILKALDKGLPDQVLQACEDLTRQDPRYAPLCLRYKADALRDLKRDDELETLLKAILADRPTPWAFRMLGSLLFKRNQTGPALAIYETALKAFPSMPALYDGLADVLVAQGDSKRAQRVLEDAVRLSPLAVRRQGLLGKLALDNEDFEGASKAFRQAVAQGKHSRFKDPETNLGFAQALINKNPDHGLDSRSRAELNQALGDVAKDHGDNPGLQARTSLMKASSLQHSDPEAAAKLAQEAIAKMADMEQFFSADVALKFAAQLQQLGQDDASASVFKNCAQIYGDDPAVMQSIVSLSNDPDIAADHQAAMALNVQGVRSYKGGDLPQAQALFRQALAMQPKNISIALNLAQSLIHARGATPDAAKLEECQSCLNSVGNLPATDARYERYQNLRNRAFDA